MTKLHQTVTGPGGDCWAACVASLIGLESMDGVPHFCRDGGKLWFRKTREWLRNRGYTIVGFDPRKRGGWMWMDIPCIATYRLQGVKDQEHAVIWEDGKIIHDPGMPGISTFPLAGKPTTLYLVVKL